MNPDAQVHVTLRQAVSADWSAITRWIRHSGNVHWWGNSASAEAEVRLALQSSSAICLIIEAGGVGVGYAQAMDSAIISDRILERLPPGTWNAGIFVGAIENRGKGYGQQALGLLIDEVFSTTLAMAISITVPIRYERAIRAFESAGFKWLCIVDDLVSGPSWMLTLERLHYSNGRK